MTRRRISCSMALPSIVLSWCWTLIVNFRNSHASWRLLYVVLIVLLVVRNLQQAFVVVGGPSAQHHVLDLPDPLVTRTSSSSFVVVVTPVATAHAVSSKEQTEELFLSAKSTTRSIEQRRMLNSSLQNANAVTVDHKNMTNKAHHGRNSSSSFASSSVLAMYPPLQWMNHIGTTSPVKDLLNIYVYDDLPSDFTTEVERDMYHKYVNESAEFNMKADVALLQLFRSYPGRTWDPTKADIFFVAYPHASHCFLHGEGKGCDKIKNMPKLFRSLTYFQNNNNQDDSNQENQNKAKHLFMALQDTSHIAFRLRDMMSFKLVSGPRLPQQQQQPSQHGVIVVPTFNDHFKFQPSQLLLLQQQGLATNPSRKYALAYFYAERHHGLKKSPTAARRFRSYFTKDLSQRHKQQASSSSSSSFLLGGMPLVSQPMTHGERDWRLIWKAQALDAYENSIFCPVLAGDVAWQGRFFDVIMSGCLPVVLTWWYDNKNDDKNGSSSDKNGTSREKSWFLPYTNVNPSTSSVQDSYPFYPGVFHHDLDIEVDYESFVVEVPGNETHEWDVSNIWNTLEDMIVNRPHEIQQRQTKLREAAIAFSYGLGTDAHRYNDAFARIIRALKHHVDVCLNKGMNGTRQNVSKESHC